MYDLDFGKQTLRDKNSFRKDLFAMVLFQEAIGFEGVGTYWRDHLVETSNFTTLGATYEDIESGGYLQCMPRHPGDNKLPDETYVFLGDHNMFCLRHGFPQVPRGLSKDASAQEQLRAYGITEKALLFQASDLPTGR